MTKGSIFLGAALFFCSSLVFLSEKFTSDRCFFITPVGYPLHLRRDSKFWMFCSKVSFEEFVLRSLKAYPLINPFVTPGG